MLEQKKRNPKEWFLRLRMSARIIVSVAAMIFCSNLLILFIVCYSASHSMKTQVQNQVKSQLNQTASSVGGIINDIGKLMVTMSTAEDVKMFVGQDDRTASEHLRMLNGCNEKLRILKLNNSLVDYAVLLRVNSDEALYVGREIRERELFDRLRVDATMSGKFCRNGCSISLLKDVYKGPEINLFCPLFEKYALKADPVAYLVVGLNTARITEGIWNETEGQTIRVMDGNGKILVSANPEEIGRVKTEYSEYTQVFDTYENQEQVVMYLRPDNPDLIVEGTMYKSQWKSAIAGTASSLALAIICFTLLSIAVTYCLCNYFYEPMEEMLKTMRSVGEGNLDIKMKSYEQSDFGQISETFNSMTDSLKEQMEMIRLKEQENTEIRLNALQSQIKPHFLYNTLESIHWQALLEGANGVSKMVMALGRYYRLSLSKGVEMIPLSQELEHMNSYIMIQNIRFDNILEMEYDIPEELLQYDIPKITLQPLVENAFYHGIKPKKEKTGHIRITGYLEDGYMVLKVSDDGVGMTEEQIRFLNDNINVLINDGSYGVKNVHNRLEIRYGAGSGLYYEKNQEGGITVTVRLPARKAV